MALRCFDAMAIKFGVMPAVCHELMCNGLIRPSPEFFYIAPLLFQWLWIIFLDRSVFSPNYFLGRRKLGRDG